MSTNPPAPAAYPAADAAADTAAASAAPSPLICPAVGRDSPPPATQEQINAAVAQEFEAQEENAISESVDVSGGASEALDDAVLNLHTANDAVNSASTTRGEVQATNYTAEKPMRHHDDLVVCMVGELEEMATISNTNCHLNKTSRGNHDSKCDCLRRLFTADKSGITLVVANYAVNHFKMNKLMQDQIVVEMYRMADVQNKRKNARRFCIPFNNFKSGGSSEPLTELSAEERSYLAKETICNSALLSILHRASDYHTKMNKCAKNFGSAKPHGNIGRKRGAREDEGVYNPIQEFFTERLIPLCEVRATETVRTMVGLRNNTDNTDLVYLPTYMSVRSVYGSYLDGLGYDIETANDGNYEVTPRPTDSNEPLVPYVSLMTFYAIWKRDYPHVKVSRQAEDTCSLCDQFANRHKFAIAGSTANSTADASLFTNTDDDTDDDLPDLEDWVRRAESDDEGEDEEEGTGVTASEESQAAGQGENTEEESESEAIMNNPNAVAANQNIENREQMIGRAFLHVEMARVQRVLYSTLIENARDDTRNAVQHSDRRYTFVVDYGQNMEIPGMLEDNVANPNE